MRIGDPNRWYLRFGNSQGLLRKPRPYSQNPKHVRELGLGAEAFHLLGDPHRRPEHMVPAKAQLKML